MKALNLLVFMCIAIIIISCTEKEKKCIITGKVVDRDSKALLLRKACLDTRNTNVIRIPITDSIFSYELEFLYSEANSLIFEEELNRGAWKEIIFFPVDGEIKMELFNSKNFSKNRIEGSDLTTQYYSLSNNIKEKSDKLSEHLYDSISLLEKNENYYSDTMKILQKKMKEIGYTHKDSKKIYNQMEMLQETGLAFTSSAIQIRKQLDDIRKDVNNEMYIYMEKHPTTVSYYLLMRNLRYYGSNKMYHNINRMIELQKLFARKFKNHPYTKLTQELLWSIENIKVGGEFFDFTLSDINGKSFTLSKEIEGKYAIIDIWAPWCSPCIASSRYMIPVFEDFKDKGFKVVGVAGRFKDIEEVKSRLEKENYPWLTLIDPDWESSVWTKYGLTRAGGGIFLVDKYGKILAIYPSADEVREKLQQVLK